MVSVTTDGLEALCNSASWHTTTRPPTIVFSTKQLHEGAESVFAALLHEAAHGIAAKTKAGNGRGTLHTVRYVVIAGQLGLDATTIDKSGYVITTLTPATRTVYTRVIQQLDDILSSTFPPRPAFPPPGKADHTHMITVYQRTTPDGGEWIGLNVCPHCKPEAAEQPGRTPFSVNQQRPLWQHRRNHVAPNVLLNPP